MKIRTDYVSNSSSSSFIIYFADGGEEFDFSKNVIRKIESKTTSFETYEYTEHPNTGEEAPDEDGVWTRIELDSDNFSSIDEFDDTYSYINDLIFEAGYDYDHSKQEFYFAGFDEDYEDDEELDDNCDNMSKDTSENVSNETN